MQAGTKRIAGAGRKIALSALLSLLAASCTSTGDAGLGMTTPGFNGMAGTSIPAMMAEVAAAHPVDAPVPAVEAGQPETAAALASVVDASDPALPEAIAYFPSANPAAPFTVPAPAQLSAPQVPPAAPQPALAATGQPGSAATAPMVQEPAPEGTAASVPLPSPAPRATAAAEASEAGQTPAAQTAFATVQPAAPMAEPPKKRGFFASLFTAPEAAAPAKAAERPPAPAAAAVPRPAIAGEAAKPLIETAQPARAIVTLASTQPPARASAALAPSNRPLTGMDALPGVRGNGSLFEITRKSGVGDNSDIDLHEEAAPPVQVASAAGLARLDPRGLLLQRETVDTACLKPALVSVLRQIEQHYGRKLVVTSAYRNPLRNAAARGALNSLHMYCAAADVQVPGVTKWDLAAYARSMPGRGGVGTYCSTESVHIDIGPERDWNWRCKRRRR